VLRAGNREDGKGARFTIDLPVTRGDERR
jgi:hypothetical protein